VIVTHTTVVGVELLGYIPHACMLMMAGVEILIRVVQCISMPPSSTNEKGHACNILWLLLLDRSSNLFSLPFRCCNFFDRCSTQDMIEISPLISPAFSRVFYIDLWLADGCVRHRGLNVLSFVISYNYDFLFLLYHYKKKKKKLIFYRLYTH
jgi:hypothetical protein